MIDLAAQLAALRAREEPVERFVLLIDGVLQPTPREMKVTFDSGLPSPLALSNVHNVHLPRFLLEVDGTVIELDASTVDGGTISTKSEGWNTLSVAARSMDGRQFHVTIREPISMVTP